jgi:hypothetical protein
MNAVNPYRTTAVRVMAITEKNSTTPALNHGPARTAPRLIAEAAHQPAYDRTAGEVVVHNQDERMADEREDFRVVAAGHLGLRAALGCRLALPTKRAVQLRRGRLPGRRARLLAGAQLAL